MVLVCFKYVFGELTYMVRHHFSGSLDMLWMWVMLKQVVLVPFGMFCAFASAKALEGPFGMWGVFFKDREESLWRFKVFASLFLRKLPEKNPGKPLFYTIFLAI